MPIRKGLATTSTQRAAGLRRRWLRPLALFIVLFAVYAATVQTSKVSVDVYSSSLASWRIATSGSAWLDDFDTGHVDGYEDIAAEVFFVYEAENGTWCSTGHPGQSPPRCPPTHCGAAEPRPTTSPWRPRQ